MVDCIYRYHRGRRLWRKVIVDNIKRFIFGIYMRISGCLRDLKMVITAATECVC